MTRKALLVCGIVSSLLYVGADIRDLARRTLDRRS
jgi:hypothetical protein